MLNSADEARHFAFLAGAGELGRLIRAHDWEGTPLGPPSTWPQSLRSALSICLHSSFPTAIYWGPELRLLYNDAWAPIPAERHPWALGRAAAEVWPDIWDVVGPQFARVVDTGEGVSAFDQMLPMIRDGVRRETYWNYSFTAIRGEDGSVVGVFNQGNETTNAVLARRQAEAEVERSQRVAKALPDLSHLAVLAVDDTAVNREVLSEALGAFGITPELAASGHEAIALAGQRRFDVIFMDCSMPDMDGFAATAAIRNLEAQQHRPPAFIVALTAHVTGSEATRWREVGMNAYVAKPFTIAQLATVLSETPQPKPAVEQGPGGRSTAADAETTSLDSVAHRPLLAAETLEMFQQLSASKGSVLTQRVFGLFQAHAPEALDNLVRGLGGSTEDGARLAHALKSMCVSAGATRAAAMCEIVEGRLKAGKAVKAVELRRLQATVSETCEAMTSHMAAHQSQRTAS